MILAGVVHADGLAFPAAERATVERRHPRVKDRVRHPALQGQLRPVWAQPALKEPQPPSFPGIPAVRSFSCARGRIATISASIRWMSAR